MTPAEVLALFEKHHGYPNGKGHGYSTKLDEAHEFQRIENPPSTRPDLCAMIKLDELCPSVQMHAGRGSGIVRLAKYDQIWFDVDVKYFAAVATEDDIVYLVRCGVFVDGETESLSMHV